MQVHIAHTLRASVPQGPCTVRRIGPAQHPVPICSDRSITNKLRRFRELPIAPQQKHVEPPNIRFFLGWRSMSILHKWPVCLATYLG